MNIYVNFAKPILDKFCSLCLIIIFSPIFVVLTVLIYFNMGTPVFFIQERAGKGSKSFNLYKFRSMRNLENGESQTDETRRITALGSFIRKTSFDELPQLFNILKGDMSFIGPRPLYAKYVSLYSDEQIKRLDVLPGLSGLAQVMGRNSISWEEKFEYDLEYVSKQSFIMDIKIAILTLFKVLKTSNVNATGNVTMEEFKGSN